jgi:hypothetical protein
MSCSASDAAALRRRDRVASLASSPSGSCFDVLIDEAIAMFLSRYGVNNDG